MVDKITIPVPGADGAPIEAAREVSATRIIVVKPKLISKSCAKKKTAII